MAGRSGFLIGIVLLLGACAPSLPRVSQSGIYQLSSADTAAVQYRMLDSVNALRAGAGVAPVTLNGALTAAAETHARDMSRQSRAWPFGSDGSSPYTRVRRSGFGGELVAEVYAQTYETELETLSAWVDSGVWGEAILDPDATDMGFGWQQDPSGLIWWSVTLGDRTPATMSDFGA